MAEPAIGRTICRGVSCAASHPHRLPKSHANKFSAPIMTPESPPPAPREGAGRSVQDYIDETPLWADATPVGHAPITNMQWFIWWLAAAGKFFEGMVVFTTGVALPLIVIFFDLGATEKGVVAAASLFGILIGATTLGGLADRYGRKQMFIVEMVLFGIFTVLLTLSSSYPLVVAALVGIGVALGCDYPTAHLIISESIPSRIRGRMVLGAFAFQAVGALVGTAVGFVVSNARLRRLRRRLAAGDAVAPRRRNALRRAALCRFHAVQFHDQYRTQRHDLLDRRRGIPDLDPRHGGGLCGLVRQNRRGAHRVPVPDPAQGYRHRSAALDPGRHQPCRRARHLALCD